MIVDCKSEFHGDQDVIQVLGVIAEDDQQTSLHSAIKEAYFHLVHMDHIIDSVEVRKEHYLPPESDESTAVGEFRGFFHHFPTRRGLHIRFDVTLLDGRTAEAEREVGAWRDKNVDNSNPILAGRESLDWPLLPGVDYHRKQ